MNWNGGNPSIMRTTNATVCFNTPDQCIEDDMTDHPTPCKGLNPCQAAPTYTCGPDYQCEAVPPGAPPGPYDRKQCEAACHPPAREGK